MNFSYKSASPLRGLKLNIADQIPSNRPVSEVIPARVSHWSTTSAAYYDLRKYSFAARIVNTWSSLPESVIAAETTNCFKNRLDKFWYNQEIKLDHKAVGK